MSRGALTAACLLAALPAGAEPTASGAAREALTSAVALCQKADFEAALKEFDKALTLSAGWKTALGHRAMCRWTLGDQAGARADALAAAQLEPDGAQSWTARGEARVVFKDYKAAAADFSEALRLDPAQAEAQEGLDLAQKPSK